MVTTSSTNAGLRCARSDLRPRRLLDRDAAGAPLALDARLRLAGHENLLGAGGERGRAHPVEQGGHLRVEVGARQKARGIEADDQRAVGEDAGLGAGGTGPREDAAKDLDGEREAVALVRTGRQQRAGRLAIVLLRIRRRLAPAV